MSVKARLAQLERQRFFMGTTFNFDDVNDPPA
jgi:hypothetical protein